MLKIDVVFAEGVYSEGECAFGNFDDSSYYYTEGNSIIYQVINRIPLSCQVYL